MEGIKCHQTACAQCMPWANNQNREKEILKVRKAMFSRAPPMGQVLPTRLYNLLKPPFPAAPGD